MSDVGPAIDVRSLTKRYGGRAVVDDLTLTVQRGETLALLGPNGAGKTTAVEILEGFRRPDAGEVRVLGLDPGREGAQLKPHIGVMLQDGGLYPTITPREALDLFACFYPAPLDPGELLQRVGLAESATTRYRRLSGGQKQRLSLALALLPNPELIFLDEPTAGMDPQARRATWEIIRSLQQQGVTIMLTTHYLEEAEQLAGRVAIINAGRLIALDTPAALVGGETYVRVRAGGPISAALLSGLPSALDAREADGGYLLETQDAPALLVEVAVALREAGIPATELRVGRGTLEEVFLQRTGERFTE